MYILTLLSEGLESGAFVQNSIVSKNGGGGAAPSNFCKNSLEQKRDNSNITTFLKFRDTPYPMLPITRLAMHDKRQITH